MGSTLKGQVFVGQMMEVLKWLYDCSPISLIFNQFARVLSYFPVKRLSLVWDITIKYPSKCYFIHCKICRIVRGHPKGNFLFFQNGKSYSVTPQNNSLMQDF